MKQRVADFFNSNRISNCKIVVALSGGPDSVALLSILVALKDDLKLNIEAAYLNHNIRSESENENDKSLVISLCKKYRVNLHIKELPFGELYKISKEKGRSLESLAREERYHFFDTLIDKNSYVALGHNLDDSLENLTMRFFQGSSIDGLKGIDPINGHIIRPLSRIEKGDILLYLSENKINYNIDKSNLENDFLRNKVRNLLLPLVQEIFPGYKKSLKRVDSDIREVNSFVNKTVNRVKWNKINNLWFADFQSFNNLEPILKKKQVFNLYNSVLKGKAKDLRISSQFMLPLDQDLNTYTETILEGYSCRLYRKDSYIIFKEIINKLSFLYIERSGDYHNSRYSICVSEADNGGHIINGLEYPFTLSSPEAGTPGGKKIKKLNISPLDYDNILIIECNSKIVAILSPSKVYYNRAVGAEKYLKIGV